MADYRVDPDVVQGAASSLSAGADSGPSGFVTEAWDVGSSRVTGVLDTDGDKFHALWRTTNDATMALATSATKAVETYRTTEEGVAAASSDAGGGSR